MKPKPTIFFPFHNESVANETETLEEKQNLSAKIVSVSSLGLVEIEFNASMFTSLNFSLINETSIDVYILPALDRDQVNNFDPNSIALTWQVVSFKGALL